MLKSNFSRFFFLSFPCVLLDWGICIFQVFQIFQDGCGTLMHHRDLDQLTGIGYVKMHTFSEPIYSEWQMRSFGALRMWPLGHHLTICTPLKYLNSRNHISASNSFPRCALYPVGYCAALWPIGNKSCQCLIKLRATDNSQNSSKTCHKIN